MTRIQSWLAASLLLALPFSACQQKQKLKTVTPTTVTANGDTYKLKYLPHVNGMLRQYVMAMSPNGKLLVGVHPDDGASPGSTYLWDGNKLRPVALPGGMKPEKLTDGGSCIDNQGRFFILLLNPMQGVYYDGKESKLTKVPDDALQVQGCSSNLNVVLGVADGNGNDKPSYLWSPGGEITQLKHVATGVNAAGDLAVPGQGVMNGDQVKVKSGSAWRIKTINDRGDIAALSPDTEKPSLVVGSQAAGMTQLTPPTGEEYAVVEGLNNSGQILVNGKGAAYYVYDSGKQTYTPVKAENFEPMVMSGITDSGELVGFGQAGPFLLTPKTQP